MKKFITLISMAIFTLVLFAQEETDQNSSEKIYSVVEDMAEFPGGNEALMAFLAENLVYPKSARAEGISGTVYISFVIEKDGSVSNAKVLRGINAACDAESLRVIELSPKWKPGYQRGKAVKVLFTLPIRFSLPDENTEPEKKKE